MSGFNFRLQQSIGDDDPRFQDLSRIIQYLSKTFPVYIAPDGSGLFVVVSFQDILYPVELSVAGPMLACVTSHPQQLSEVDYLTVSSKVNDANASTVCAFFVRQGVLMSRMLAPLTDPELVRASIVFGVVALHCLYKALFSDKSFMDVLNETLQQIKGELHDGHTTDSVDSDS